MNKPQAENPLQRIKDAIRVDADAIRQRAAATPAAAPERVLVANPAPHASTRHDVAINELCGFHSVDFIERAFIAVLGRPADENSVQVHLAQLNAGRSKLEILGDLRWSPEGRARAVKMPGLYLRYLLIKLGRVPVIGRLVESAVALASVAAIARHQRAADSFHFARVEAVDGQVRDLLSRIETLAEANAQLRREKDALSAELRETRQRLDPMQAAIDATSAVVDDSRQRVLSLNHWLASLRHHLAALELSEAAHGRAVDATHADIARRMLDQDAARGERLDAWADALIRLLPAQAGILDLGSGNDWIGKLRARNISVTPDLARSTVSHAEIADVLTRTATDSVSALSVLDVAPLLRQFPMAALLDALKRILHPQGWLMIGLEQGPLSLADQLQGRSDVPLNAELLTMALRTAGFADIQTLASLGVTCLVARHADPPRQ